MFPYFYDHAEIIRWVDGDTVELRITVSTDVGFRVTADSRVRGMFRLWGINTPEPRQAGGPEATAEVNRLAPPGSVVAACTYKDKRGDDRDDSFGRWLANIFVGSTDLNQHLVDNGFAVEYMR